MSKISLREKITIHLRGKFPHWVSGDDIERFGQAEGAKGSAARRRVQELAERGVIERGETEKGYVQYRWKSQEDPSRNNIYRPEFLKVELAKVNKLL